MNIVLEISNLIIDAPSGETTWAVAPAVAAAGIQMAGQAVGGAIKAVGSLFGGGKRRREQRAAQQELAGRMSEYESLDTSNPYKNLTNTYENLTVNTQAADFASQQSSQGAANIMGNLAAAAGGGGVAALAQSLANSQAQAAQQASVTIGQQEQRNAMLGAQGEQQRQQAVATGERQSQKMNMEKTGTMLGMAQQRKAAADQARKDATDALVGGMADMAGGVASASMAGMGGENKAGFLSKDSFKNIMGTV
jgi:hypothetical protein